IVLLSAGATTRTLIAYDLARDPTSATARTTLYVFDPARPFDPSQLVGDTIAIRPAGGWSYAAGGLRGLPRNPLVLRPEQVPQRLTPPEEVNDYRTVVVHRGKVTTAAPGGLGGSDVVQLSPPDARDGDATFLAPTDHAYKVTLGNDGSGRYDVTVLGLGLVAHITTDAGGGGAMLVLPGRTRGVGFVADRADAHLRIVLAAQLSNGSERVAQLGTTTVARGRDA